HTGLPADRLADAALELARQLFALQHLGGERQALGGERVRRDDDVLDGTRCPGGGRGAPGHGGSETAERCRNGLNELHDGAPVRGRSNEADARRRTEPPAHAGWFRLDQPSGGARDWKWRAGAASKRPPSGANVAWKERSDGTATAAASQAAVSACVNVQTTQAVPGASSRCWCASAAV